MTWNYGFKVTSKYNYEVTTRSLLLNAYNKSFWRLSWSVEKKNGWSELVAIHNYRPIYFYSTTHSLHSHIFLLFCVGGDGFGDLCARSSLCTSWLVWTVADVFSAVMQTLKMTLKQSSFHVITFLFLLFGSVASESASCWKSNWKLINCLKYHLSLNQWDVTKLEMWFSNRQTLI